MRLALLKAFIRREIKERLVGSVLGPFVLFLQPLLQILTFIFLFKLVFKIRIRFLGFQEDFLRFFLVGYLPWSLHAEALSRGGSSVVQYSYLVTRIKFPVEVLPTAAVLSVYLTGLLAFLPLLLLILALNGGLPAETLLLPLLLPPPLMISWATAFIFSALSAYFRDFLQVLPALLLIWFYATPVLYSREMLPHLLAVLCALNPLTPVVESWEKLILLGIFPVKSIFLSYIESIILLIPSYFFFKKLSVGFADVL